MAAASGSHSAHSAHGSSRPHDSLTEAAHAVHGSGAPVVAPADALDDLLYPPAPRPHRPGRKRSFTMVAQHREIEIVKGVKFDAWTYNGTVPGPILRVTEDDLLSVRFVNSTEHPHSIHFHGIHPADMDGVLEPVDPGQEFLYEFRARPAGVHPYHCHVPPLREHIQRGLYGALIVDPKEPRKPAQELVMVMNGFDTDKDGENNFYTVNGIAFFYAKYPIKVKRSQTVRIYLINMTEFDAVNSFHLHADFFRYQENGHPQNPWRHTDNVAQIQAERGVIEIDFAEPGMHMFHAHQTEFIELGWTGFFDVQDA
ncbi:MAG: multicopper oxidase domain-containing protein [Actinobacteria bacterium]|nr:multicopper oxidase domain-containing protein [Actinomycetota bacterium]